jgi:23S rRNA A1618 N6-methylase RlmF
MKKRCVIRRGILEWEQMIRVVGAQCYSRELGNTVTCWQFTGLHLAENVLKTKSAIIVRNGSFILANSQEHRCNQTHPRL